MALALREVLQRAATGENVWVPCENSRAANNLRQRFYRYRDKVRTAPDPLTLLADNFHFEVRGRFLKISFQDETLPILQKGDRDEQKNTSTTAAEARTDRTV